MDLERLYRDIRDAHLQPLWISTESYVPRQPAPKVVAAHWAASNVFALLREAGRKVSSDLADRRALVCNNPGLPPFSGTTQTVYACVQLLLPGERTCEHRHSQSAFRFVLSGEGACTILNGQKVHMRRGDFIVTPPWTWHGHANDSGNELIWLDGLDNAIVRLFDATFFELPPERRGPQVHAEQDRPPGGSNAETYWLYDWMTMRHQLDVRRQSGVCDLCHGYRIRYLDPHANRDPLPTIAAHLSYLPRGFAGERYRSSDSTVFVVVGGKGCTKLETTSIQWSENDIFTIPTWEAYQHTASEDAVLFSFSDQAAQERLGCWREQRGG
jgi:gentisate 1,2-dioxygenase